MLELIPNLLVDQVVKPLDVKTLSAEVSKQVKALPLTKAAIAAPETLPTQLLPTSLVATANLSQTGTATAELSVPPSSSEDLPAASDLDQAATAVPAPPASEAAPVPPAAQIAAPSAPPADSIPAPVALPAPLSDPAPTAAATQPVTPTADPNLAATPIPIAAPAAPVAASPPVPADNPQAATAPVNAATAITDRKKVIEQRLAEIVAKDRQLKTAKQETQVIASAIAAAQQGDFTQARTLLLDPAIPAAVQTEVMSRIAALQLADTPSLPQVPMTSAPQTAPALQPISQTNQVLIRVPSPEIPSLNPLRRQEDQQIQGLAAPTPPPPPKVALPSDDSWMRSQQFNFPGPQLNRDPQFQPPIVSSGRNPGTAESYSTTPLTGQQQAIRTPLGRPGNGDLRLMYPLPTPEPVTSPFGWRVHPVTGERRLHTGTDIGAAAGTPILAAYSGKIVTADQMGGYGLAVVIEHNNGSQDTLYAHMSEILVRPGQSVQQGAVIGRVGSTGMSTGPHLHFELRQKTTDGWQTLDPGPNLQAAKNELVRALQAAQQPIQPAANQGQG